MPPQIRNKLNQDQNSKLQQQKELLNKRNMEVTLMDKRIGELRERLYKKKAEARQKENLPVRRNTPTTPPPPPPPSPPPPSTSSRTPAGEASAFRHRRHSGAFSQPIDKCNALTAV